jgi:hypothetical protein
VRLVDKYTEVQKIGKVEVPHAVWTVLGLAKNIEIVGNQLSLANDSDFCDLDEARKATVWLVEQLGGKVKWSDK